LQQLADTLSAVTAMKMLLSYSRPKSAPELQFVGEMTDIKALFAVLNSREDFLFLTQACG